MQKKSLAVSTVWIIVLVLVFLLLIGFGYFGLRFLGVFDFKNSSDTGTTQTTSSSSKMDSKLVGSWDTGCLVPDPNSPWAEEHTFTIDAKGKAVHTRSSGESCAALKQDHTEEYQINIPASGQIDFVAKAGAEGNIYDIYAVSGNTLTFGHGFCNCSTICSASGGATPGDRITCLNQFLVYKK